ncbi:MAG: hypothetical protein JNJ60_09455 [Rhodocyclaceae bacterium]|nr:hypothetical protein [Rhodocyclaceae bacterium]
MKVTTRLVALTAASCAALIGANGAQGRDVTDLSFDQYVGSMERTDTGSGWFDYYVYRTNQEIAAKDGEHDFGAAGPNGPIDGFDGYLQGFVAPDTGSTWFNDYVDRVNALIQDKQSNDTY